MNEGQIKVGDKLLTREEAQKVVRRGASWFYWVAGFSLVSVISLSLGAQYSSLLGLGSSIMLYAFGVEFTKHGLPVLGALLQTANILYIAWFAYLGWQAGRLYRRAFVIGMSVYALDSLIFLAARDFFGLGLHALVLFFMYGGLMVLKLIQSAPVVSGKYSFGFTATASDNRKVSERVNADTVEQAFAALEKQGFRDITLHDTEASAIKLDDPLQQDRLVFSVQEEQDLRHAKSFAGRTAQLFFNNNNMLFWVPLSTWLIYALSYHGWPSNAAALPAAGLATFLLWFAWANVPSALYQQALDASTWCQWEKVLSTMGKLERWTNRFKTPMPRHELLFRTATAEAGLGRLDDALRRVAPLETDGNLAPGFYQGRLASVFFAAREYERMAQTQREAHRLNPTTSSAIDLATTLARWVNQPQEAEQLLASIDPAKLPPLAQIFVHYCRGVIALGAERPDQACSELERSLLIAKANPATPLMQGLLLDARAHYGLALCALGRKAEAIPHFDAARPMTLARKDEALLARCEAALNSPT